MGSARPPVSLGSELTHSGARVCGRQNECADAGRPAPPAHVGPSITLGSRRRPDRCRDGATEPRLLASERGVCTLHYNHVYSTDRRQIIELRQARASLCLSTTGYAALGYAIIFEDFGLLQFVSV